MNINYENLLYSTLSQEANLFVNKKILAQVGLNLAAFISFLIDKGRYHKSNDELTEDGYFFATNEDIHLFTGIPRTSITKLKKQGQELGLFSTKKLENSFKSATHYKLNFEKILTILSVDKSVLELAYERALPEENKIEEFSESTLIKFSCRELRLVCKKLEIPYSGKDNKMNLINKILNETLENKELNKWTEKSSTSGQKNHPLKNSSQVDGKTVHQWTEKVSIGGQENCHKKNQNQKKQNQKNQIIDDSLKIFENLFNEFEITFTKTNQTSVFKLLRTMKEKDVIQYLKETYENIKETPNVKSIARLFSSKIAKGERQINSTPKSIKEVTETKTDIIKNIEKEEKKSIEEETIIELSPEEEKELLEKAKKDPTANVKFIINMKSLNKVIYYNTLLTFKDKDISSL
ncbi:hypothetical protein [uncultured Fusobacterium sp.]|jgi:hypothetical protein|uniref:hypothetical protein n=1 Tax=uncultured Fusobacterium sp. TaxID=159267 RepID=UPI0015A6684A|nr:hypothetical protein [uncultured Fusobacterium sp.]